MTKAKKIADLLAKGLPAKSAAYETGASVAYTSKVGRALSFTDDQIKDWSIKRSNGMSFKDIALEEGEPESFGGVISVAFGLRDLQERKPRKVHSISEDHQKTIIEMHNDGKNSKQISKEVPFDAYLIREFLKSKGFTLKRGRPRKGSPV